MPSPLREVDLTYHGRFKRRRESRIVDLTSRACFKVRRPADGGWVEGAHRDDDDADDEDDGRAMPTQSMADFEFLLDDCEGFVVSIFREASLLALGATCTRLAQTDLGAFQSLFAAAVWCLMSKLKPFRTYTPWA